MNEKRLRMAKIYEVLVQEEYKRVKGRGKQGNHPPQRLGSKEGEHKGTQRHMGKKTLKEL